MKRLRSWSFHGAGLAALAWLGGFALCDACALLVLISLQLDSRAAAARAESTPAARAAQLLVRAQRPDALAELAALTLSADPHLASVTIRAPDGRILARAEAPAVRAAPLQWLLDRFETSPPVIAQTFAGELGADYGIALALRPAAEDHRLVSWLGRTLRLLVLVTLLATMIGAAAFARIGGAQRRLTEVAHDLAQGRSEARASQRLTGATGALAEALNALARHLSQAQDERKLQLDRAQSKLRDDVRRLRARLKETEEELRQSRHATTSKSELLSSMSHELRTPLTAILGFADLLLKTPLSREQREYANTVLRSAQGLLGMINDLLDWSRIEAGKLALQEAGFTLADCVEDTVSLLAPLAYDKGLELVHIIYHDVPLRLRGDPVRLQQIITNLLSNAIKFTERGEVTLRVMKERDEPERVWLRFSVSDTGIGIAPEVQRRLFEVFTPGQEGGRVPSSGLGLAITKKLLDLMDGEIIVESKPGKGSTFSVVLGVTRQPEREQLLPKWEGLRGLSAWVLELHRTARLALVHSLEYWGLAIRSFEAAGELRESLRHAPAQSRPDLVVVGLKPQDLDDPAIGDVLSLCADREPPLLALVSSVSHEVLDTLTARGAARCLSKSASRLALYRELSDLALSGGAKVTRALEGQTVLVADNNVTNRRYLANVLARLGARVLDAPDGRQAVALWQRERPRFALLDVNMPELDGPGASREIRAREGSERATAIIGTSAHLDLDRIQALFLAGMDDYLQKPFDERQLVRALSPWLSAQRVARPEAAGPPPGESLTADPELRALLAQELPLQLQELEAAYAKANLPVVRAAAHQLHGTAAFYRLGALRQAASAMESRLADGGGIGDNPRLRDDMILVREAVMDALRTLRAGAAASV